MRILQLMTMDGMRAERRHSGAKAYFCICQCMAHCLRHVGCVQDPNWRSLLHHCAAHGAFRGAGAELVAGLQLPRGDTEGAAMGPM